MNITEQDVGRVVRLANGETGTISRWDCVCDLDDLPVKVSSWGWYSASGLRYGDDDQWRIIGFEDEIMKEQDVSRQRELQGKSIDAFHLLEAWIEDMSKEVQNNMELTYVLAQLDNRLAIAIGLKSRVK